MTIEIMLVIAILGFCVSLYFNITNSGRAAKEAYQKEATISAKAVEKLDGLKEDVDKLQKGIEKINDRDIGFGERLTAVEQSDKSAHKRIDGLEKKFGGVA